MMAARHVKAIPPATSAKRVITRVIRVSGPNVISPRLRANSHATALLPAMPPKRASTHVILAYGPSVTSLHGAAGSHATVPTHVTMYRRHARKPAVSGPPARPVPTAA